MHHCSHRTDAVQDRPRPATNNCTYESEKLLTLQAAVLSSRISDLRTTMKQLAKEDRRLMTAPGRGAALQPLCQALAEAASQSLDLLEKADLLPDQPFLDRLVEAKQVLASRSVTIHHRRSAGPAFDTMRAMSLRLDVLAKPLLLCIGQPPAARLTSYISEIRTPRPHADGGSAISGG
jgi:hypothetical protein